MRHLTSSFPTSKNFRELIQWYEQQEILPWQQTSDPYLVWISEIMLQQTTVPVVRQRYAQWQREFPTLASVAIADLQSILRAFEGLGYYARARHLHKTALWIAQNGWPTQYYQLCALPGLGDYTAKTILSRCFGQYVVGFDVNIERFFARLIRQFPLNKHQKLKIEEYLVPFQKKYTPEVFSQAIMRFAQNICKKRDPQCLTCPFQQCCQAYQEGEQTALFPKKNKRIIHLENYMIIIEYQDQILVEQRTQGIGKGLCAFPRLSLAEYEKFYKKIGKEGQELPPITHTYTQYSEKLYPRFFLLDTDLQWDFGPQCEFINLYQLENFPFLACYRDILLQVEQLEKKIYHHEDKNE
ncbi:MAG: hypothetical protein ACRCVN_03810 [Spirochaetia bacterium]